MNLHKHKSFLLFFTGATFFVFSSVIFLSSLPPRTAEAAAAPHVSATISLHGGTRPLEMHIANNGLVLLRSARVVSVDGTTIVVSTAWGSADFAWTVHTNASSYGTHDFGTRFLTYDGKKSSLADMQIGNLVTITGTLDTKAVEPTLDADTVRILE